VIIVTPYLVRPVNGQLATPVDGYRTPHDGTAILEGQTFNGVSGPRPARCGTRRPGLSAGAPVLRRLRRRRARPRLQAVIASKDKDRDHDEQAFLPAPRLAALAGCQVHRGEDRPARGLAAGQRAGGQPRRLCVRRGAPGGSLAATEAARLDGWFRGLELGYGDVVSVDGADAASARADVARVAGRYGLLVSRRRSGHRRRDPAGRVRVVVSRTRASVPGCPNWSRPSNPNYSNELMSNFGCAVNGNLAAMVANPGDLVSGREARAPMPRVGNKAIESLPHRSADRSKAGLSRTSPPRGGN
jgi:pilus assembly protein CpaD